MKITLYKTSYAKATIRIDNGEPDEDLQLAFERLNLSSEYHQAIEAVADLINSIIIVAGDKEYLADVRAEA